MSGEVWFTSDQHFGHKRMAEVWRPQFRGDVDAMDEALIEAWNRRVGRGDRVYHLGDFSFRRRDLTSDIIDSLQGEIHVVRGNHDGGLDRFGHRFASYEKLKEIKVGEQRIVLCHFPLLSWHDVHHGSWMLHGHCHGNLPEDPEMARMDVGVTTRADLAPWSLEEVRERLAHRRGLPGDHHGADGPD